VNKAALEHKAEFSPSTSVFPCQLKFHQYFILNYHPWLLKSASLFEDAVATDFPSEL